MLNLQNADVFRSALESLQSGVCMVDQDRKISFWNDGAERITGYLRQDVLGRVHSDVLVVKLQENKMAHSEESCALLGAMRDGKILESHAYLHHKAGYAVPVIMRAAPIRNAQGLVIGATESFVEKLLDAPSRPESGLVAGQGLDAVTQLPDYPFTESYLLERFKFAVQYAIPFALLCIQLEQLDTLTERHGLDAKDAILNVVAHTLRNGLHPLDFVGRWSDDQFLAIVRHGEDVDLLAVADRLKRLAQSSDIIWWGDHLSVTVSVGGTVLSPGEPIDAVLERIGRALQQAGSQGGNFAAVLYATDSQ